ncbi:MAG: hypothetical protein LBG78_02020 [Azoarcus sp.]|nr:hypothetical protein [Azoarcus sp.]
MKPAQTVANPKRVSMLGRGRVSNPPLRRAKMSRPRRHCERSEAIQKLVIAMTEGA